MRPSFPNRPAPERERILALLRVEHREAGVTTAEIAARLGRDVASTHTYLGRLCAYGFVRKMSERPGGHLPHELNRWKLP